MTLPRRLRADAGRAWSAARRRDLLVPGTVTVSVVAATAILTPGHWTDPGWAAVLLLGALLRWRHRRPIAVAVTSLAVCAVYYPLSPLDGPAIVVPVVALYAVAGSGRTRAAAGLAAVAVGAAWYGERLSTSHPFGDVGVFMLSGWLTAVVALGTLQHGRAAHAEAVRREAAEAARAREAEAARRAGEDRLRLAQEVHDVVGHHLSLIAVQAGAALHRLDAAAELPTGHEQAGTALAAIRTSSRRALDELRDTLRGPRPPADDPAPLDWDELLRLAPGGPEVVVRREGSTAGLPAAVELAAYRTVQEALTNVRRHAPAARRVDVRIRRLPDRLEVQVEDDGGPGGPGGPAPDGSGSGLAGMARRALAGGGSFSAGRSAHGFTVRATLPATGASR